MKRTFRKAMAWINRKSLPVVCICLLAFFLAAMLANALGINALHLTRDDPRFGLIFYAFTVVPLLGFFFSVSHYFKSQIIRRLWRSLSLGAAILVPFFLLGTWIFSI